MVSNTRSVELEIRAQDFTGKTIQEVRKSIKGLKDDLDSQAKAASKGKADFKKYADGLKELANEANKLSNLSAIVAKLVSTRSRPKAAERVGSVFVGRSWRKWRVLGRNLQRCRSCASN